MIGLLDKIYFHLVFSETHDRPVESSHVLLSGFVGSSVREDCFISASILCRAFDVD